MELPAQQESETAEEGTAGSADVTAESVAELLKKVVHDGELVRTFAYCERRLRETEFAEAAAVLTNRRLLIVQSGDGGFRVTMEAPRSGCRIINSKTRDDGSILAVLELDARKAMLYFPPSWSAEADQILVSLRWGDHPEIGTKPRPEPAPPAREVARPDDDQVEVDTFAIVQALSGLSTTEETTEEE